MLLEALNSAKTVFGRCLRFVLLLSLDTDLFTAILACCDTATDYYNIIYKRKNRRASRAIFSLIGLRQAKVVHADTCSTYSYSTLRGGIDPGHLPLRLQVVGVVDVWRDF